MGEAKRKNAAEASDDENSIPRTHGPASAQSTHIMRAVMDVLRETYPGCQFTMFVFEPPAPGTEYNGRYNYASTVDREDMLAVLRSFIARADETAAINEATRRPSEGSA